MSLLRRHLLQLALATLAAFCLSALLLRIGFGLPDSIGQRLIDSSDIASQEALQNWLSFAAFLLFFIGILAIQWTLERKKAGN
ncbi:hypothetical protein ACKC9G_01210 [Pokkaliibacter sp. CJK22405]|uniref:hypothetical protein n=1 Tax=Pokkaliibacter sp. CJK22405 TaxID=3384615 RepID=UPI003984EF0E